MAEIGDEIGAYDTLVLSHPADKRAVWEARSAFLTVIEAETDLIDEMDVVVPVDKIPTFLEYAHEIGDKYEFAFAHLAMQAMAICIFTAVLMTWMKQFSWSAAQRL